VSRIAVARLNRQAGFNPQTDRRSFRSRAGAAAGRLLVRDLRDLVKPADVEDLGGAPKHMTPRIELVVDWVAGAARDPRGYAR